MSIKVMSLLTTYLNSLMTSLNFVIPIIQLLYMEGNVKTVRLCVE